MPVTLEEVFASSKKALEDRDKAFTERDTAKSELKSLQTKMELTPVINGVHGSPAEGVMSYFESAGRDEPNITIVQGYQGNGPRAVQAYGEHLNARSAMKSLIRSGYAPCHSGSPTFKSVGQFFREGIMQANGLGSPIEFRDKVKAHFKSIQGMSEAVGSDGGFGVIPEYNLKIHEHLYSNNILSRTDSYTVSGNNMTFLANAETSRATGQRAGGLTGYWTGEGAAITPSKPTIRELQMKLQKLAVVVYLTDELLKDNSIALEQYVTRKAAEEFQWLSGNSIFNGTGAGQPLGIQNAPSLLAIAAEGGQSTLTIVAANIIKMQNRLFAPYMQNSSWFINQDTMQQLMQLTLATGTYSGQLVYMPPTGLAGAPYGTLGGRPVEPIEFAKSLTNQGDITLADLSQILSITKGGVEQATSMHVEFLTDQLALRFTMRLNAQPWENSPITPANGTNTQSSFVTLAAR